MKDSFRRVSRRQFLKATGMTGGLVLGATMPLSMPAWAKATSSSNPLNLFVSINTDNSVDIVCHRSEMGQGVRTGIPQVIADELCADWSKINVIQGLANKAYGSQNTDGSTSIRQFYDKLREMGAAARTMLEQAAAEQWQAPLDAVYADDNQVFHRESGQSLSFGELAEQASKMPSPDPATLRYKSPGEFKYIGKPVRSVDMEKILTGDTVFGQDIQLQGMLYASIERSPVTGGKVKSFDKEAAMAVKGVVDVVLMPEQSLPALFKPMNGVAVIASHTWAALQGRKVLNVEWDLGEHASHDSASYLQTLVERVQQPGEAKRVQGDAYAAIQSSAKSVNATYTMPYLVHAQMEPPAATATVSETDAEIWACTQTPQSTQENVANALGLDIERVKVNVTLLGGAFGRKSKPDFSVEAALLASAVGQPVKVVWSREDDIQSGYYHAISAQHFRAGMDNSGRVNSWIQRTAFPSIGWTFSGVADQPGDFELSLGFADNPVQVENLSCEIQKAEGHIRIGWLRSVSNIQHAFALGSFIDELAVARDVSSADMWFELLGEDRNIDPNDDNFEFSNYGEDLDKFPVDTARFKNTLRLAIEKSNMNAPVEANQGWGLSVHRSFVSYVAVATKVEVIDNRVKVLEMHSVTDAGLVVNPDRANAQMEGAMIFGLSLALMGEITVKDGAVVQSNYHDYPVLRMSQSPVMTSTIVESDAPPGGIGEPGVPPVAPSLTNAIYQASGIRIRDLPVNKVLTV